MNDAKESGSTTQETAKTNNNAETRNRVSNEQILESIVELASRVDNMRNDIEALKRKAGFFDQPVTGVTRKNSNTDPGPWSKPVVKK